MSPSENFLKDALTYVATLLRAAALRPINKHIGQLTAARASRLRRCDLNDL